MRKSKYQLLLVTLFTLLLSACVNENTKTEAAAAQEKAAVEEAKIAKEIQAKADAKAKEEAEGSTPIGLDDSKALNGSVINNPICAPDCVFEKDAIFEASSKLAQKIIYFDYDRSRIKAEFVDMIDQHATYLTEFPDTKVRLEGHSDEQGAREYNVALGEQRAKAVKRYLQLKGVTDQQISIVSFGEELPARLGHSEESWSLNRRVEIVYE